MKATCPAAGAGENTPAHSLDDLLVRVLSAHENVCQLRRDFAGRSAEQSATGTFSRVLYQLKHFAEQCSEPNFPFLTQSAEGEKGTSGLTRSQLKQFDAYEAIRTVSDAFSLFRTAQTNASEACDNQSSQLGELTDLMRIAMREVSVYATALRTEVIPSLQQMCDQLSVLHREVQCGDQDHRCPGTRPVNLAECCSSCEAFVAAEVAEIQRYREGAAIKTDSSCTEVSTKLTDIGALFAASRDGAHIHSQPRINGNEMCATLAFALNQCDIAISAEIERYTDCSSPSDSARASHIIASCISAVEVEKQFLVETLQMVDSFFARHFNGRGRGVLSQLAAQMFVSQQQNQVSLARENAVPLSTKSDPLRSVWLSFLAEATEFCTWNGNTNEEELVLREMSLLQRWIWLNAIARAFDPLLPHRIRREDIHSASSNALSAAFLVLLAKGLGCPFERAGCVRETPCCGVAGLRLLSLLSLVSDLPAIAEPTAPTPPSSNDSSDGTPGKLMFEFRVDAAASSALVDPNGHDSYCQLAALHRLLTLYCRACALGLTACSDTNPAGCGAFASPSKRQGIAARITPLSGMCLSVSIPDRDVAQRVAIATGSADNVQRLATIIHVGVELRYEIPDGHVTLSQWLAGKADSSSAIAGPSVAERMSVAADVVKCLATISDCCSPVHLLNRCSAATDGQQHPHGLIISVSPDTVLLDLDPRTHTLVSVSFHPQSHRCILASSATSPVSFPHQRRQHPGTQSGLLRSAECALQHACGIIVQFVAIQRQPVLLPHAMLSETLLTAGDGASCDGSFKKSASCQCIARYLRALLTDGMNASTPKNDVGASQKQQSSSQPISTSAQAAPRRHAVSSTEIPYEYPAPAVEVMSPRVLQRTTTEVDALSTMKQHSSTACSLTPPPQPVARRTRRFNVTVHEPAQTPPPRSIVAPFSDVNVQPSTPTTRLPQLSRTPQRSGLECMALVPNCKAAADGSFVYDMLRDILLRTDHCKMFSPRTGFRVSALYQVQNELLLHAYSAKREEFALRNRLPGWTGQKPAIPLLRNSRCSSGNDSTPFVSHTFFGEALHSSLPALFDMQSDLASSGAVGAQLNECFLLHGTQFDVAQVIAQHGFDERVSSMAGLFGAGVYFTNTICKSYSYSKPQRPKFDKTHSENGEMVPLQRCLLICRVLLGDAYITEKANRSLRRPPSKDPVAGLPAVAPSNGLYDSVIGNGKEHKEFVLYDRTMVYPAYVVQYEALV